MNTVPEQHHFSLFIQNLKGQPKTSDILCNLHTKDTQTTLLLFLIWYSLSSYGRLTKQNINTLHDASASWHEGVVKALSRLANTIDHQQMDPQLHREAHNLGQFALQAELDMLENTLSAKTKKKRSTPQQLTDSCHNIAKYLSVIKCTFQPTLEQKIHTLLFTCFSSEQPMKIITELSNAIRQAKVKTSLDTEQLTLANDL